MGFKVGGTFRRIEGVKKTSEIIYFCPNQK